LLLNIELAAFWDTSELAKDRNQFGELATGQKETSLPSVGVFGSLWFVKIIKKETTYNTKSRKKYNLKNSSLSLIEKLLSARFFVFEFTFLWVRSPLISFHSLFP